MPKFILPSGSRKRALPLATEVLAGLDESIAWQVTAEPVKSARTASQNAYLFGVCNTMISEATGYEVDEVHEYLCGQRWGWQDKRVPKTPRNPSGVVSVPIRTTTRNEQGKRCVLTTTEFSNFVDFVQRFAAKKLGLVIPDPDPHALRERAA